MSLYPSADASASPAEFENAVQVGTDGLKAVSTGLCPGCPDCLEDHSDLTPGRFEAGIGDGSIFEEPWFSWSPCECCGSTLGGDRVSAHGVDANGEIIHFSACVDCMCYLANGDLPEDWQS